jgi:Tfp pilus assembly protein PilF
MRRALVFMLLVTAVGCRSASVGPYAPPEQGARETTVAEKLNREAADVITADPAKAEALLREALTKDIFYGPAHNNLGVVFLAQDKLYEAANEFEWARKLMPGHPDPHVNLALVMERAGRNDDAFHSYEAALAVAPECVGAMQGAAILAVRTHRDEPRLAGWLDRIALGGDEPGWRFWALAQSAKHSP